MKAFKIAWPINGREGNVDLACIFRLPAVHCDVCGETWGNGMVQYPCVNCEMFAKERGQVKKVVTVTEFAIMADRIVESMGRSINILPGGSFGLLSGTAATRTLGDFVWGTILYPQISKYARDLLDKGGVALLTAEADIRYRGRIVDTHVAIQAEPVALLTETSLNKHAIKHCAGCNHYSAPFPNKRPKVPEGYEFKLSEWPKGHQLVTVTETLDILASEDFMESVRRHGFKGIRFEECGVYV